MLKESRNLLIAAAIITVLAGATALATSKPAPNITDAPTATDSSALTR